MDDEYSICCVIDKDFGDWKYEVECNRGVIFTVTKGFYKQLIKNYPERFVYANKDEIKLYKLTNKIRQL